MRRFKVLFLFLLIGLVVPFISYAANTQTDSQVSQGSFRSVMVLDTTNADGDNCLNVDGAVYKSIIAKLAAGTAVWDISFSNDNKTKFADLWTGEAASESYEFMTKATHVCVNLTTCTACTLNVTIYGGNE